MTLIIGKVFLDRLNKIFPNAKYILVLRNQKDFILSMYAEYLKKGGQETIENFLSAKKTNLNFSRGSYLHYNSYYDYIISKVGKDNIKIFYYEVMKRDPHVFFKTLLSYFNLSFDIDLDVMNQKENVSFSTKDYEVVRFFNKFCKSSYSPNHFVNRKHLQYFKSLIHYMVRNKSFEKVIDNFLKTKNFNNKLLPEYTRIKKYGY